MMKTPYFILFLLAGFFSIRNLSAQEHLVPLTVNPVQAAEAAGLAAQRTAVANPTDTVIITTAGLRDNFEYDSHRPDTSLWELDESILTGNITPGVFINRTWAKSPVNLGVCTFDGLKWNGEPYVRFATSTSTGRCDELMSRPIDLSRKKINATTFVPLAVGDSVYLSFWYQAGGFGYMPNAQDSLLLDFNIPAWDTAQFDLTWKNIWYKEGYNAGSDSSFHLVLIKLDSASYFTKGFRFRFRNYAAQCGSNDHWHIDEVMLKPGGSINDSVIKEASFVYEMPSFLKDFRAMPASHYKPALHMTDTAGVTIRNNDTLSTGRNVAYNYSVLDEAGTSIYNYSGGSATLLPFEDIGYSNVQSHARPAISANFAGGFPIFAAGDSGFYTIRHKLTDGARVDSADFHQAFYNYYAYDDGTAEVGYGLYGQYSQLAYKFTMPPGTNDNLVAIQMYFLPVFDIDNLSLEDFTLKVWSDNGNQPGNILFSKQHCHSNYLFETPDRFVTYVLDSFPVALTSSQTYYIGWEQQGIDRLYVGFDWNDDHSDKIYYNTTGNWNQSIFDGSLMIRPVFGTVYPGSQDQSGIHENISAAEFSVYPNPAGENIYLQGNEKEFRDMQIKIFDISGREVMSIENVENGTPISVSGLSNGMYSVQARSAVNGASSVHPLIISH